MTQENRPHVLIADDEDSIRVVLARAVEKAGALPVTAADGDAALATLKSRPFAAAFVDIRMPGPSGLELLDRRDEFAAPCAVVVMTAEDTMDNAVAAMKRGAYDYLTKPFDLDEVAAVLKRAIENANLRGEVSRLKDRAAPRPALVGKSRAMTGIFKTVGKVADQDVTVLIRGESGTGKELIARAIHFSGNRAAMPFVAVNCSAIPDTLLESELFGHRRGAFTGAESDRAGCLEEADGGTVFLDEIGDMPPPLQAKLLRFLQDKSVRRVGGSESKTLDVRVVAATHRPLEELIRSGRFREDLYFRLNVVPIVLPALAARREDVKPLVEFFAEKYGGILSEHKRIAPEAVAFFESRDWPGNVRELENAVKRALVLARGDVITADEVRRVLDTDGTDGESRQEASAASWETLLEARIKNRLENLPEAEWKDLYERFLPDFERPLIRHVMAKVRDNQVKAAAMLGLNRNTLRKKINKLEGHRKNRGKTGAPL